MKNCKTPGCEREISDHSRTGRCTPCNANLRFWDRFWEKARPAHLLARRARLSLYTNRTSLVMKKRGLAEK